MHAFAKDFTIYSKRVNSFHFLSDGDYRKAFCFAFHAQNFFCLPSFSSDATLYVTIIHTVFQNFCWINFSKCLNQIESIEVLQNLLF